MNCLNTEQPGRISKSLKSQIKVNQKIKTFHTFLLLEITMKQNTKVGGDESTDNSIFLFEECMCEKLAF